VDVTRAGFYDSFFTDGTKSPPQPVQIVFAGTQWNAKGLPCSFSDGILKTIQAPL